MTPLEELIAAASDDQLRATRRFLHRAYLGRDRLGWPSLNPFDATRDRVGGDPDLVPALCLELSAELVRRSAALPCLPCAAEIEVSLARARTATRTRSHSQSVLSATASGTGG